MALRTIIERIKVSKRGSDTMCMQFLRNVDSIGMKPRLFLVYLTSLSSSSVRLSVLLQLLCSLGCTLILVLYEIFFITLLVVILKLGLHWHSSHFSNLIFTNRKITFRTLENTFASVNIHRLVSISSFLEYSIR